ncbi:hypothetical protein VOM14_13255 [Paraburkholderia sp. MPAMCS5]|nr:hypothetical protein [Paraburkholderia sp. MPAMCS5]
MKKFWLSSGYVEGAFCHASLTELAASVKFPMGNVGMSVGSF